MRKLMLVSMCTAFLVAAAVADWNPGDGHKMHFPQLPNPDGWDVEFFVDPIADDWQCSRSGPVDDIHFWTSWALDDIGQIGWLNVDIHKDIPDPDPSNPQTYSMPGDVVWSRTFQASEFVVVSPYGIGDQGFYDPGGSWALHDHTQFQQINIIEIDDPFIQVFGDIYWLSISADWTGIQSPVGWKTSLDHFQDIAVYWNDGWFPLYDPSIANPTPLSLAFVITPEPASLLLLGLGGLLLRKRR